MIEIHKTVIDQLKFISEDPNREGLIKTPLRVIKSWKEIYSGYDKDPKECLTTFTETNGYNQMIVLKDVELFSTCEHHMLPFFGKAHVAYIPDGKVIGISKLARLVDIFSRRLQIQERLCEQITEAIMEHLQPKGAACFIQAQHMCMLMRGCNKQNSIMETTSLKGSFLEDFSVKSEFLSRIK